MASLRKRNFSLPLCYPSLWNTWFEFPCLQRCDCFNHLILPCIVNPYDRYIHSKYCDEAQPDDVPLDVMFGELDHQTVPHPTRTLGTGMGRPFSRMPSKWN